MSKRARVHQVTLDLQPLEAGSKLMADGYPAAMETDLKWVWAVVASSFGLGWLIGRHRR